MCSIFAHYFYNISLIVLKSIGFFFFKLNSSILYINSPILQYDLSILLVINSIRELMDIILRVLDLGFRVKQKLYILQMFHLKIVILEYFQQLNQQLNQIHLKLLKNQLEQQIMLLEKLLLILSILLQLSQQMVLLRFKHIQIPMMLLVLRIFILCLTFQKVR